MPPVSGAARLHESDTVTANAANSAVNVRMSSVPLLLEYRINEHGRDDNGTNHDLLEKRRHPEQVEAVPEHAHDQRADQGTRQRAFSTDQAGAADHGGR